MNVPTSIILSQSNVGELREIGERIEAAGKELAGVGSEIVSAIRSFTAAPTRPVPAPAKAPRLSPRVAAGPGEKIGKAERRILTALAQYPNSRKSKVAKLAVYAVNGGGFCNALGHCRSEGWIEGDDVLAITNAGVAALGHWDPLPTGRALADRWLNNGLGKAEREIFQVLIAEHPRTMTKEQIAAATPTGYAPNGGGFANAMGRLRTLELITGRTDIKAADELFEE